MKANNQIVQQRQAPKGFSEVINGSACRAMIDRSINDPQRAAAFVSTLISVVNANPKLRDCEPGSIISAALRGEIGLGLSLALGEYSVIPYGRIAQFQLQVNGLKHLCIRSGQYKKFTEREVRQGEFKGYDNDGDPLMQWNADADERESLPIVGYYASYELLNGFRQCIYWTHKQILKHADRYSQAFNLDTYNAALAGKRAMPQGGSPWYNLPDDNAHMKMCRKTVVKQLLSDGFAPKEVLQAVQVDNEEERNPGSVILDNTPMFDGGIVVDTSTGEVLPEAPQAAIPAPQTNETAKAEPQPAAEPKKRGRPAKTAPATEQTPARAATQPAPAEDEPELPFAITDDGFDPDTDFFS